MFVSGQYDCVILLGESRNLFCSILYVDNMKPSQIEDGIGDLQKFGERLNRCIRRRQKSSWSCCKSINANVDTTNVVFTMNEYGI